MKFCQILDNKAHWIFEADDMPQFAPDIILKDITNVTPQPQEGWNYDVETNTYAIPSVDAPTIPQITDSERISATEEAINTIMMMLM